MASDSADETQIFLSYSRKDSLLVSRLAKALAECGYSAWLDVQAIHAGRVWREEIVNSIETCAAFILVLSENSALSENVIKELSLAESSKRSIFPVLVGDVQIPPRMKYQLAGLQFVEIGPDGLDACMARLLPGFETAGLEPSLAGTEAITAEAEFIGRTRELAKLEEILASSVHGRARHAVITGEAGSGKSALINVFQRRAQRAHPELIVAVGGFSQNTDYAEPYQPWIEILRQLTGDVESAVAHGHLTLESADRLRQLAPEVVAALTETAPGLIGDFISGASLLARTKEFAFLDTDATEALEEQINTLGQTSDLDQAEICRQFGKLIGNITASRPLLLIVDDMHRADMPSLELLTQLLRSLNGSPLFVLGACAQIASAQNPGDAPHPLIQRLETFKRKHRDDWIDLDSQSEQDRRAFVRGMIDREPNRLDDAFREKLFAHTDGNPMFTSELLRSLQDSQVLVEDAEGNWVIDGPLNWEEIPPEIVGLVEQKIGTIEKDLRDVLAIASVEGENFTAQVIARVQELQERDLLRNLTRELEKRHRLIREVGAERLKGKVLSHFNFKHGLLQQFLYDEMGASEKMIVHGEIAQVLEDLYQGDIERVAFQLARHYDLAGEAEKAIGFLTMAGRRASRMSAYGSARQALARAIELTKELPEGGDRDQHELDLQIMMSAVVKVQVGWDSSEVIEVYEKARALCQKVGPTEKLAPVLFGFWVIKLIRLQLTEAIDLAEELRALGESLKNKDILQQAWITLGNTHFWIGDQCACLDCVERAYDLYDPDRHDAHLENYGQDPRSLALMFSMLAGGLLGDQELADKRTAELKSLIQEMDHPFTQAIALQGFAWHHFHLGQVDQVKTNAQALIDVSTKHGFGFYKGVGLMFDGWADGLAGQAESGCARIEEGFHDCIAAQGASLFHSLYALLLAGVKFCAGDLAGGFDAAERGIEKAQRHNERCYLSELYRCVAETLRQRLPSVPGSAMVCLTRAQEIARSQGAILFELRAAVAIGEILSADGREIEAEALVAETRSRFPDPDTALQKTLDPTDPTQSSLAKV